MDKVVAEILQVGGEEGMAMDEICWSFREEKCSVFNFSVLEKLTDSSRAGVPAQRDEGQSECMCVKERGVGGRRSVESLKVYLRQKGTLWLRRS